MKAIISADSPGSSWAHDGLTPNGLRNALASFLGKSVISTGPEFSTRIREFASRHPGLLNVLFDYLHATPQVPALRPELIDFSMAEPVTLEDAPFHPKFLAAVEYHSAIAEGGEQRDLAFQRMFGHLLPHSLAFQIYDPYAISNLWNQHSTGMKWLLFEKLAKLPIRVEINSVIPSAARPEPTISQFDAEQVFDDTTAALRTADNLNPNFSLRVNLYSKSRTTHDRFARLKLSQNSICVELSRGAEVFSQQVIAEPFVCHALEIGEYELKRKSWPPETSMKFSEEWPRS